MKSILHFPFLICLLFLISCQTKNQDTQEGVIIFRTGFEANSNLVNHNELDIDLTGTDNSVDPPNNWDELDNHPNIGFFHIEFQGGDTSRRKVQIIEDPVKPGNHVLQYWMKYPNVNWEKAYGGKTRIQTDFYENTGIYDIYYKVKMYLTKDWEILKANPDKMEWYIMAEYWNNAGWLEEGHQFRMHLLIKKDSIAGGDLYFEVGGQPLRGDRTHLWQYENHDFSIPIEEWIELKIYLKEGDKENGRYYLAVTRANGDKIKIFDITNFTHHPEDSEPDGFKHLNLLKAYSHNKNINYVRENGGILQVLWDDLEVWTGKEPEK